LPKQTEKRWKLPIRLRPRWETPEPPGVCGTYGDQAIEWGRRELGITVGPWQAYVIRQILRYDKLGDLIIRIALISTGRQNGKSVIVRILFGWLLDEGQKLPPFAGWTTLLAAAHDAKQARIIYKGVYTDLSSIPRLLAQSKGARHEKPVRLTEHFGVSVGALTLDTVTGQPGSARGLSAGAVAWDEMLTQRDWDMWEALSPTQSAQRSPIMVLTSTAGHADSVVLRSFYDRLKREASGAVKADPTFYGAWWESEDPDAGLDWKALTQANPALGDGRLTKAAIASEFAILPTNSWKRERLNHFVDETADAAFSPVVWARNRGVKSPLAGLTGPYALGVDIQPGWERASICVGGMRDDGKVGIEVYRDFRRTEGEPVTAARIIAAVEAFPDIENVVTVAYDQVSGGAPAFERNHDETGLPWDPLKPAAMVSACMDFTEMLLAGNLAVDDPLIDAQIATVAKRPVGQDGAFRFSRQASSGPIDTVMAMALAAHAISYIGQGPLIG